ncbi:hypothetical protein LINGRAHAP2_LOCUS36456 [Linum grandiflorum]
MLLWCFNSKSTYAKIGKCNYSTYIGRGIVLRTTLSATDMVSHLEHILSMCPTLRSSLWRT